MNLEKTREKRTRSLIEHERGIGTNSDRSYEANIPLIPYRSFKTLFVNIKQALSSMNAANSLRYEHTFI